MNEKFKNRLIEFLDCEATDYGMSYIIDYDGYDEEDDEDVEVKIKRDGDYKFTLYFRYDEKQDDLLFYMYEDNYEIVQEYEWTVKYFWMVVAPRIFPNN